MNLIYPVSLKTYASGQIGVRFPDVPEAITAAANEAQALEHAMDALLVALSGYIDASRNLPTPSRVKRGQRSIALPARVAFKFAIVQAMRAAGLSQAQFGARLGLDARQVRRIIDLEHESTLAQLEAALAALGLRASVTVLRAA